MTRFNTGLRIMAAAAVLVWLHCALPLRCVSVTVLLPQMLVTVIVLMAIVLRDREPGATSCTLRAAACNCCLTAPVC